MGLTALKSNDVGADVFPHNSGLEVIGSNTEPPPVVEAICIGVCVTNCITGSSPGISVMALTADA